MITLRHGTTAVEVDPDVGGRVAGWTVEGRHLLRTAGPDLLRWGCYPLVPWAGRVRDGRFAVDDRNVLLTRPEGESHALHGVGYHQPWTVEAQASDSVTLSLDLASEASRAAGWPFGGTVEQFVAVGEGEVSLAMTVQAGPERLPLVVGWHPWFLRDLDGVAGAVMLTAEGMLRRGDDQLPTGEVVPPTEGPWDDCFVGVTGVPGVRWPGVGEVSVESELDHVVVFDSGPLGICVEPQSGPPDAFNIGGYQLLDPGRSMTATARLRWTAA